MNFDTLEDQRIRNSKRVDVQIEVVEGGTLPTKAHLTDVGFDCYSRKSEVVDDLLKYYLGFKINIPEGYGGFLFPRSSIKDFDLALTNCVGVVDPGFFNEVTVYFRRTKEKPTVYTVGSRCCQLVIMKLPEINLVKGVLSTESRGGYGSSGV